MTTKTPITNPEAIISEIQRKPAAQLHALQEYLDGCQSLTTDPSLDVSILSEIKAGKAAERIADFKRYPIEFYARQLADEWVAENVKELVALLRSKLTERSAGKESFISTIGKRAATISREMFSSASNRQQLALEREKLESEADELESAIVDAGNLIHFLEAEPSLDSFRAAEAGIARVQTASVPA